MGDISQGLHSTLSPKDCFYDATDVQEQILE